MTSIWLFDQIWPALLLHWPVWLVDQFDCAMRNWHVTECTFSFQTRVSLTLWLRKGFMEACGCCNGDCSDVVVLVQVRGSNCSCCVNNGDETVVVRCNCCNGDGVCEEVVLLRDLRRWWSCCHGYCSCVREWRRHGGSAHGGFRQEGDVASRFSQGCRWWPPQGM